MAFTNRIASEAGGTMLAAADRYQPAVTAELHAILDGKTKPPYTLMRYHFGWEDQGGSPVEGRGGKMLRPALCLLCCEAAGGDWEAAVPAAAALELLHNFTLIHDDVEDASRQRHGRDTLWSIWGSAQAINAGDGMFALAHATILRLADRGHEPGRVLRAAQLLDEATLQLCEGQHRDLLYTQGRQISCDDYLAMIAGKTAALIAASCGIGALLGGGPEETVAALSEFGRHTGLAFQVRDDLLGVWGDTEETGKPASDDLRAGKQAYPVVTALERAGEEERASLLALLAKERRGDDDIEAMRSLLERLGAHEEGERVAHEHAAAAAASLDDLDLQPTFRDQLVRIAAFAAQRAA